MTTAPSSPPDPADPPDSARPSFARLIELALVVPVEVSTRLIDVVPMVVDKVPAAAGRVRREIVLARFIGKLAVDQGVREIRARLAPNETASPPEPATLVDDDDDDAESGRSSPRIEPDASTLALADYDHLSSAQIVAKLDGLDATERQAIEEYERAGRHRRTILGKLDQLRTSA
jgi:hypothetical protein